MRKECLTVSGEKRTCPECLKTCCSTKCFEHHKKSRKSKGVRLPSKCETSFKCQTCSADVERKQQDNHRCGERVCHICKEYVLSDHLCYMQPEPPKKPNDKLICYDFETDFFPGQHVVNFAVGQYSDGTKFVFKGYNALHEFCAFTTPKATGKMQLFLDTFDTVTDLNPCDSFFGGRVGGYKLFREAKADETIEYLDFTLYPFVNKTKKYPTPHPMIIRKNFQHISNYFDLIKS